MPVNFINNIAVFDHSKHLQELRRKGFSLKVKHYRNYTASTTAYCFPLTSQPKWEVSPYGGKTELVLSHKNGFGAVLAVTCQDGERYVNKLGFYLALSKALISFMFNSQYYYYIVFNSKGEVCPLETMNVFYTKVLPKIQ